ncbi:tRNA lysidine(34) synthetase TilS [Winogradskyella litorisediminis]|uniref:tRNA(Ile)-lysidine synthase n=1 Tax=Winogradskyella litorisediminis TaxID=1156618 RepID=A0ABW3NBE7_9FLAO
MLLGKFQKHINQELNFLKESRLIIAISGGIDSVVLAYLSKQLNFNFVLVHCNFLLRGKESDADEEFVIKLGEDINVEVFTQRFDTEAYARENKLSIQMAARELRYGWFNDLAEQLDFDYILTAHHADDNLETFLINFTRGTGLNGLIGIPMINGNIVRALLPFSRETIENYAKENDIKWRDDSSNSSRKYLRNKLRHELVPILKEINPQLLDSFQNTLENLKDTAYLKDDYINQFLYDSVVFANHRTTVYDISYFEKLKNPKAVLFEIFNQYGFTEWNDIVSLLSAETGKKVYSKTHRLIKDRDELILDEINTEAHSEILLSKEEVESGFSENYVGHFNFKHVEDIGEIAENIIYLDAGKLKFPLKLRLWNTDDVFYPLGLNGKKKVSKLLKDEKTPYLTKENTWVLTSNDKIVWVLGMRVDERFKVSNNTSHILKITLNMRINNGRKPITQIIP